MNLVAKLFERAALHPERAALIDSHHGKDRVLSYASLAQRVGAAANSLRQMDLHRGQVVLVFQPVSIELYIFLLACFHSGIQVMLADPSAGRDFLANCCKRLMPDAFFGPWKAQCLRLSISEMRHIKTPICSSTWFPFTRTWRESSGIAPLLEMSDDEPALVTFTSGSTGLPKAAVRSHGFLLAQHRALSTSLDFQDGEVDLITLPVFVLANLASGLTSVLAATNLAKPGQPNVPAIRAQCEKFQVTRCAASPAFFEGLLHSPEDLPHFQKLFTGGAPVFPDLLKRLREKLPTAEIHAVYGSTEAEPIAHFSETELRDEIRTITQRGGGLCSGIPISNIELNIIRDSWGSPLGPMNETEFATLTLPHGEAGEIIVTGDHVLRGYLAGIGDLETKIHVSNKVWHRTGDAGWIDPQGRVWLLGRCAEKLGENLAEKTQATLCYPFAIECALRENFPKIRSAAIQWDQKRTLIIETSAPAAIDAQARLLGMEQVIRIGKIPTDRRHHAKIDYPALRQILKKS